jgi:AraC-like DNA-binding protein
MSKLKKSVTEYRNYFLPMDFPVLLLSGDYWKISDIPSGRLHFHNCLEIGVCHSDSGIMEFYGEPLQFQAGDITVIPRNVPHTTYSDPSLESHWSYLFLDPHELFHTYLPGNWADFDLSVYQFRNYKHILSSTQYPHVKFLADAAIRELSEKKPNYQLSARGLLLSLYIELYRIQSENDAQERSLSGFTATDPENALIISPALDYMEDHYMEQFTMEYLADLCHWSPTHFRRIFHAIMNTSPLDYLNTTRVMKSCNLLLSTEESILDISEMVGFHSVSSYNRYFIRIMQTSPREYRKRMHKSENQSILEYAGWMFPE